jgi:ornithine--oxo-acid transaminase
VCWRSQRTLTCEFVLSLFYGCLIKLASPLSSIRFAPPLVISEEELAEAVKIIGECLVDLDQLEDIPGDEGSEKGYQDMLDN